MLKGDLITKRYQNNLIPPSTQTKFPVFILIICIGPNLKNTMVQKCIHFTVLSRSNPPTASKSQQAVAISGKIASAPFERFL